MSSMIKGFHRIGFTGPGDITIGQQCQPTLDGKPLLGVRAIRIEARVNDINRVVIEMDALLGDEVDFTAEVETTGMAD